MALSITYWVNYTSDRPKLIRKSENSVNCDRVLRFLYDIDLGHIEGHVQASMKDKSSRVQIELNDLFGTDMTRCECPMGNFYCHHVTAVLLFGYKRASKTDVKCSWLKTPKSKMRPDTATMEDLFPPRKPGYRAFNREIAQEDRDQLCSELGKLGRFTALRWILSPEPEKEDPCVVPVEDVLMSAGYIQALCKRTFVAKTLLLSPDKVKTIAAATSGQRNNPVWSVVRRHRIISSNFGCIFESHPKNSSHCNFEKNDSIAWGINHERNAIDHYCKLGDRFEETGIWLHESGILGTSPDGIVVTPIPQSATPPPDIIEVKCPFSARDKQPLDAIVRTDGRIILPNDHEYLPSDSRPAAHHGEDML